MTARPVEVAAMERALELARRGEGLVLYAAGIAVFYAVVLMQLVHYPIYEDWGLPWLSAQGRYLFPVLIPIYGASFRDAPAADRGCGCRPSARTVDRGWRRPR